MARGMGKPTVDEREGLLETGDGESSAVSLTPHDNPDDTKFFDSPFWMSFKNGFYHATNLYLIGTKEFNLEPGSNGELGFVLRPARERNWPLKDPSVMNFMGYALGFTYGFAIGFGPDSFAPGFVLFVYLGFTRILHGVAELVANVLYGILDSYLAAYHAALNLITGEFNHRGVAEFEGNIVTKAIGYAGAFATIVPLALMIYGVRKGFNHAKSKKLVEDSEAMSAESSAEDPCEVHARRFDIEDLYVNNDTSEVAEEIEIEAQNNDEIYQEGDIRILSRERLNQHINQLIASGDFKAFADKIDRDHLEFLLDNLRETQVKALVNFVDSDLFNKDMLLLDTVYVRRIVWAIEKNRIPRLIRKFDGDSLSRLIGKLTSDELNKIIDSLNTPQINSLLETIDDSALQRLVRHVDKKRADRLFTKRSKEDEYTLVTRLKDNLLLYTLFEKISDEKLQEILISLTTKIASRSKKEVRLRRIHRYKMFNTMLDFFLRDYKNYHASAGLNVKSFQYIIYRSDEKQLNAFVRLMCFRMHRVEVDALIEAMDDEHMHYLIDKINATELGILQKKIRQPGAERIFKYFIDHTEVLDGFEDTLLKKRLQKHIATNTKKLAALGSSIETREKNVRKVAAVYDKKTNDCVLKPNVRNLFWYGHKQREQQDDTLSQIVSERSQRDNKEIDALQDKNLKFASVIRKIEYVEDKISKQNNAARATHDDEGPMIAVGS